MSIIKTLDYISSEVLISEVKDFLPLYWDANKLDESILDSRLRHCLSKLKLETHPLKFSVLEVENFKVSLPEDFQQLCLALACHTFKSKVKEYNPAIRTEERHVCELNLCETTCDVCHDDCGNMFKIVQVFEDHYRTEEWTEFEVLNIGKHTRPMCSKDCFNFRSKKGNQIEIKNKEIHTTFCKGLIYIEYVALLEKDSEFLIPNNETIIDWIKKDLLKTCLEYLFLNGEPNLLQRLQYAEKNLAIAQSNARVIYKRNEVQDYYRMANTLVRRYNNHRDWLWSKEDENYISYNNSL